MSSTSIRLAIKKCPSKSLRRYRRYGSTIASETHQDSDIVIVGGGPAGLALASALGSSKAIRDSLQITLVESGDLSKVRNWSPPPGTYSNRVSSLTNASQAFLKKTGAWSQVEVERTCPMEEIQAWDGISDARMTFSASDLGLYASSESGGQMARLTENHNLQRGLLRHLEGIPEVQILDKTKVSSIVQAESDGDWPLVHLDSGRTLRARLLVGADGFNSPVRTYAGISSYGWAYDTHAIVATMVHPPRGAFQGPNTTAYQRFLPTGPIAFLPLSPTVSSLVWSTKPPLAAALIAAGPDVLPSMINAAFRLPEVSIRYLHKFILDAQIAGSPVTESQIRSEIMWREQSHAIDAHSAYASSAGPAPMETAGIPPVDSDILPPLVSSIQPGTIASFPLRFTHTDSYIGEGRGSRTVLVGDAAHTVHPLAGQGLNMGLGDVECLTQCLHEAVLRGGDVGSYTSLLPYAQQRYFENHKLMSGMDKLHKLYASTLEPVVWARSVGLEVINEFDSVKAAIMMTAGAYPHSRSNGENSSFVPWNLLAKGVEGIAASVSAGNMIRSGLSGMVSSGLQGLLKSASSSSNNSR